MQHHSTPSNVRAMMSAAGLRVRCVIYVRVSTNGQETDGTSLASQESACVAYAEERGWSVIAIFRETHTASELHERRQLSELRALVRGGAADVVLCYALDRLSRKQTHVAIIAEEIEESGAKLAF